MRFSCPYRAIQTAVVVMCVALLAVSVTLHSCRRHVACGHAEDAHYMQVDSLLRGINDVDSLTDLSKRFHAEGDEVGMMLSCKYLGKLMRSKSYFEEAIKVHSEGFELASSLADTIEMAMALNNIGTDYRRMGNLSNATNYHYRALRLSDACSDHDSDEAIKCRLITLNGIGNIEIEFRNFATADSVLHEALCGEIRLGSEVGKAINYANLGSIKRALGDADSAWYYYNMSQECNRLAGNRLGEGLCHQHFGELYEDQRNYTHAKKEYLQAYEELKQVDDNWHWLESCLALASVNVKLGEFDEARRYLDEAEQEAIRNGSLEYQADAGMIHYSLAQREGNHEQALKYYIEAQNLEDSVRGLEKNDEMRNMRFDYERELKSGEMNLLNSDIERLKRMRNILGIFTLLLLLMGAAITAALIYAMRVRTRSQRMLRQVEETRSLFFTNVVHMLRTPLTAIVSAIDNIIADVGSKQVSLTAEQRGNVDIIERQGENLLLLVDRILEVGSVRSEINKLEWKHGDVVPFMRMVLESYRERCLERRIQLTYASRENSAEIDTVPSYLSTIVGSLMENAISYCREFCKITVTTSVDGKMLTLRVADDGMGIAPGDLPHVFEPFYRGAEAERLVDGVGIGLTVVRDMTMAMGGTVAVDSMKGRGTVFTVKLPCHNESAVKQRFDSVVGPIYNMMRGSVRKKEDDNAITEVVAQGKPDVLVVEDHSDVAHLVGQVLADDFTVHYAYDGEQGLARALELKPLLVITDVKMPVMDGYELCRRLRASECICNTPVLMLTARATVKDRIQGIEAGADVYMVKPFDREEMRAWVNHLVQRGKTLLAAAPRPQRTVTAVPAHQPVEEIDDKTFLERFAQLVDDQFKKGDSKLNLDRIAMAFKMGESQLKRRIQSAAGKNVTAYVSQLRMEKAMRLLRERPDLLIGDVAEQCGFVDVAYFSRVFRQHYNMTPTQARNGQAE